MAVNQEAFEQAMKIATDMNRRQLGIGTLAEKTVHAVLKNYYQPNEAFQEIKVGRYVADIYQDGEILEIQTGQFDRLRKKLEAFLPVFSVTVIYPIPENKWIIWIDEETGSLSSKRKSPAKGSYYTAFKELYRIKMHLNDPNLKLKLVLLDLEEYRLLNGWSRDRKKGSRRYDRIPVKINSELELASSEDYVKLLPAMLPDPFTTKEFAKAAEIKLPCARYVVPILAYLGIIEKAGKKGREYLYRKFTI